MVGRDEKDELIGKLVYPTKSEKYCKIEETCDLDFSYIGREETEGFCAGYTNQYYEIMRRSRDS